VADKKLNTTNDPFETSSPSLLKAGIALTPFAAGVGISVSGLLRDGIIAPRASAISDTIQSVVTPSRAPPRPSYNDHLVFMQNARNRGMFKDSGIVAAQSAWATTMSFADPFAVSKLPKPARDLINLPQNQVIDALEHLATYEDKITTRLFSKFRRNFNALSKQGTLRSFSPVTNLTFDTLEDLRGMSLSTGLEARIKGMSGGGVFTSDFYSRPGFIEEGLGMHRISFGIAGKKIEFNLPKSSGGVLVEGMSQSSRRIAPSIGIINPLTKGLEEVSREEFFLRELETSIISDIHGGRIKTQAQVNKAINKLYERVFASLENIPNITPEMRTYAQQRYQDIRGQAIDLVTEAEHRKVAGTGYSQAMRPVTQEEMAQAMEKHGLFAGTGGEGLSKGRVQKINIAEEHLFPRAVSWSRKPESAIRAFELTQDSQKAIAASRYARFRDYEVASARANPLVSPHLKALYVNPEVHAEFLQKNLMMGEGEVIGRMGLQDLIEHQFIRTKHLNIVAGKDFGQFVKDVQAQKFKVGDVIGWDQSGDVITMQKNMKLLNAVGNRTKARGDFATLYFSDIRRLENNAKWFGDFKGLMRLTRDGFLEQQARRLTKNDEMLRDLDVIVSMDELRKDPAKYSKQILTSMTESVRARGALPPGTLSADVAMRPRHYAGLLEEAAMKGGAFNPEQYTRAAMKLASELNFTQAEFGSAFGAAPTVLGKEVASKLTFEAVGNVPGYAEAMAKGLAGGIAQVSYGGPEELRGAGKLGSLEPRAFEILRGEGFTGEIGPQLQKEFVQRMIATNPDTYDVHHALTKTLASMKGMEKPSLGENIFKVAQEYKDPKFKENFQSFIERGGGWLDPGKGMHSLYIPGPETALAMKPYETAGGIKTTGALANIYHGLVESAGRMYTDIEPASIADVKRDFAEIAKEIHKQQAPGGKGMGAYMRGKLTGSRFFTGVSAEDTGFRAKSLFEVGLSEEYAKKMFSEMRETSMYNATQLAEMEKRFMTGGTIGGVIARHPFIDDFSMQQILFRRAQTKEAQIVIPEKSIDIKLKGIEQEHRINLGPLVGMAGDKDSDIYSAMLVSPNSEEIIRKNIMATDSEYAQRYAQHQVRYQMMKAGKPEIEALPTIQNMIGEARALATTPEWVPKLSVQMNQAKSAIRRFGPEGAKAADAQALLTWMEQTPIGGKHLSAQQAYTGELSTMMQQLSQGLEQRDITAVREVINDIMQGNKVSENLLKGNVELEDASVKAINATYGREVIKGSISGPDINSALETIMSSMNQYKTSGALREEQLLFGRGSGIKNSEISEVIGMARSGFARAGKVFSNVSSAFQATRNTMGVLGRKMIKNAKPVGIGFAAMLGIGAILSTPDELVGPGAAHIPHGKINMNVRKAADRVDPEDLHPSVRGVGVPHAPNMLRQRTATIAPRSYSKNMYIRGTASRNNNISGMIARTGNITGNRNINVNIMDQRSSLNPHVIANKIA